MLPKICVKSCIQLHVIVHQELVKLQSVFVEFHILHIKLHQITQKSYKNSLNPDVKLHVIRRQHLTLNFM